MSNLRVFRDGRAVANAQRRRWALSAAASRRLIARPCLVGFLVCALPAAAALAGPGTARAERRKPEDVQVKTPVYRITTNAFQAGERWQLEFRWSGIPVGRFAIELSEGVESDGKRLNIDVTGTTNSFIDLLWRYRLHAKGWVFTDPFAPGAFHAEEHENSKFKTTDVEFDDARRVRAVRKKGDKVSETEFMAPNTYDILSAVFMIMGLDHHVGDEYYVDTLTGTARYLVTIGVQERGAVMVAGESVDAFRLVLHSYDLTDPEKNSKHTGTSIWVSASRPKRLLKAESKTFVGSIYGHLTAVQPLPAPGPVAAAPGAAPETGTDSSSAEAR